LSLNSEGNVLAVIKADRLTRSPAELLSIKADLTERRIGETC
jgi:hypothetical protein